MYSELYIPPIQSITKRNPITGRFLKGHIPYNKGMKGQCAKGCEKGWFKKGHKPKNKPAYMQPHARVVEVYKQDGTFIATFKSITDASRKTGIERRNIAAVCKGKRKSAGCYLWKFAKV